MFQCSLHSLSNTVKWREHDMEIGVLVQTPKFCVFFGKSKGWTWPLMVQSCHRPFAYAILLISLLILHNTVTKSALFPKSCLKCPLSWETFLDGRGEIRSPCRMHPQHSAFSPITLSGLLLHLYLNYYSVTTVLPRGLWWPRGLSCISFSSKA